MRWQTILLDYCTSWIRRSSGILLITPQLIGDLVGDEVALIVHHGKRNLAMTKFERHAGPFPREQQANLISLFQDREVTVRVLVVPPLLAEHDLDATHYRDRAAVR